MTSSYKNAVYSLDKETHKIEMSMYAENRQKLIKNFKSDHPEITSGLIFLAGGQQCCRYSSDTEVVFRQDSFFHWAFGVREPDVYGTIDVASGKATLIIPKYPEDYVVWFGEIRTTEHYLRDYNVEDCIYEEDLADHLDLNKNNSSQDESQKTGPALGATPATPGHPKIFEKTRKYVGPKGRNRSQN